MIKTFEEIRKEDVSVVGGKGANLGEMTSAGIFVPPGFVVTAKAYQLFLQENGLTDLFLETVKEAKGEEARLCHAADLFRKKILAGTLPQEVKEEIKVAYDALCEKRKGEELRVAIRSSATAEDLPESSFAGQQETYLNVVGIEDVYEHIVQCYASIWGERAVLYRQARGYNQKDVALAVVVQEMIQSETAGVLFTVNPVTQNEEEMQIDASYGLGESVVSGHVTADAYICDRSGTLLQMTIGDKKTEIVYEEKGTKKIEVSSERQKERALNDADLIALCEQGNVIEEHYNSPMDIEWAIRGGKVFILQARPITTLKKNRRNEEQEQRIKRYLAGSKPSPLMKKNLAFLLEKMPDVCYPFDSDMTAAINTQKSNIFAQAGIETHLQPQMDTDGIETLPPHGNKITKDIFKAKKVLKEMRDVAYCRDVMEQKMPDFEAELEQIKKLSVEQMTLAQCGEAIEQIYEYVQRVAYTRFYYAMFPSMLLQRKCEKMTKKVGYACSGYEFLQNLDNRTARCAKHMSEIAKEMKQRKDVMEEVEAGADYNSIYKQFPEMRPIFKEFFKEYGYMADFNCYCIHARSFFENPDRLFCIVRPLLEMEQEENPNQHADLMRRLQQKMSKKDYKQLEENVKYLRYFHVEREESQYMWETAFYMMRRVLSRTAYLSTKDDNYFHNIAYLFEKEVVAMCKRGYFNAGDRGKIERRRRNRPLAKKVWERSKLLVFSDHGDVLKGVSGSTGEVVGKACIVNGPEEFYKLKKGEVLVCPYTEPEWTPLFTLASAVVADTGAALSHAAIVAREYGIPAVLGVGLATSRFKDGDMIRVDGTNGEVTKVK